VDAAVGVDGDRARRERHDFFRWRQCRWGQEQHRDGLLPHSGQANRRYRELERMGREIARIGDLVDTTRPRARVAIVLAYESRWAIRAGLDRNDWDGAREAVGFHNALIARNFTVDALDPREDLSGYALVIAPRAFCVDGATAANLTVLRGAGRDALPDRRLGRGRRVQRELRHAAAGSARGACRDRGTRTCFPWPSLRRSSRPRASRCRPWWGWSSPTR
jgi:hypothetical protein